jgi:hypothetical protein
MMTSTQIADDNLNALPAFEAECQRAEARAAAKAARSARIGAEVAAFELWQLRERKRAAGAAAAFRFSQLFEGVR